MSRKLLLLDANWKAGGVNEPRVTNSPNSPGLSFPKSAETSLSLTFPSPLFTWTLIMCGSRPSSSLLAMMSTLGSFGRLSLARYPMHCHR